MDMNDAIRRRLEANIKDSGWHVLEATPDPSAVRFWLYSINLVRGPRLGTQATAEFFRDLKNDSGVFKDIKNSSYKPNQLLGNTILSFDEATNASERQAMYKPVIFSLGAFARSTQTWDHLPSLSEVPGIHFTVVDWIEPDGNLVMRPFMLISEKTPPIEAFIAGMAAQLVLHLNRFPKGVPKEWSDLGLNL